MELRHIRVFMVLAEELHFGRAAARLRIAQSAVSQTLKKLEGEVGATLLTRTKRRVNLSPAGQRFLEHATSALQQLDLGAAAARQAELGETGKLVLRFTLMSALTVLPRAVATFQRRYPLVTLSIGPGGTTEQLEALRSGACDVGFMTRKRELPNLESMIVEQSPLVIVLAERDPLAKRKTLALHDLAACKFVFLKQESEPEVTMRFRQRCISAGFDPQIVVEVDQLEVLLAFVAAGVGISCVPALVSRVRFSGIRAVPLSLDVMGGISAVWDPKNISASGRRFLEILREERDKGTRPPPMRR
jgi:DNA-binding transcriptional LysR family regulator